MNSIRVMDTGVKNMPLRKRPKWFFKGKLKNEIILLWSLKRTVFFKEPVSLKTFDFRTRLQVFPFDHKTFLKELFLKENGQPVLSNRCLRN